MGAAELPLRETCICILPRSHARPMTSPLFHWSHSYSPDSDDSPFVLGALVFVVDRPRVAVVAQILVRGPEHARKGCGGKAVLRIHAIALEDLDLVVALALSPERARLRRTHGRKVVCKGHGPLLHVDLHRARLPAEEREAHGRGAALAQTLRNAVPSALLRPSKAEKPSPPKTSRAPAACCLSHATTSAVRLQPSRAARSVPSQAMCSAMSSSVPNWAAASSECLAKTALSFLAPSRAVLPFSAPSRAVSPNFPDTVASTISPHMT